jgi:hypothetical protein
MWNTFAEYFSSVLSLNYVQDAAGIQKRGLILFTRTENSGSSEDLLQNVCQDRLKSVRPDYSPAV